MSDLFTATTTEAREWRRRNGLWYVRFLSLHSRPTPPLAHPDALGPRMHRLQEYTREVERKGVFRANYPQPDYQTYERRLREWRQTELQAYEERHKTCAACKAIAEGRGHQYWIENGER